MIDLLDGNVCAAWGARIAKAQCVPCFPITPTTEIIETIASWKAKNEFQGEFVQLDSEHSVGSAAFGASITGARVFTATSSQGLLLMHELLPIISGCRTPMVMATVSRCLSAPIGLWPDHNDTLAMRDAGWIMFICETNQEVLDSVIMGYKISENPKILLPVIVNMDGFVHSYTRTQVNIPDQKLVDKFLPHPELEIKLDVKKPMTLGIPAMGLDYMRYRAQLNKAMQDSFYVIEKVQKEWARLTKRKYDFIEEYKLKDAKAAIVMIGANTTIARAAVDDMRAKGKKVGLLRIRLFRPFPEKQIRKALEKIKHIAVVDQNICPGMGGILYPEIKMALSGHKKIINNYINGLGGNFVSEQDYISILKDVVKLKKEERKWQM
ncbi:pyruvate ferredoxin oxidoreductase [Candidatus Woesearchaeota archaeon]|nr:pyruvate ferredoxin oxidoreductase [Candidatus Woesearchaeota archaeon]